LSTASARYSSLSITFEVKRSPKRWPVRPERWLNVAAYSPLRSCIPAESDGTSVSRTTW
jgi:hypothetical protein